MSTSDVTCCVRHMHSIWHVLFSQHGMFDLLFDMCHCSDCRTAEFDIMFDHGIDSLSSTLQAAEVLGVLMKKGSWYYLDGVSLGQGRDHLLSAVRSDPHLLEQIESRVQAAVRDNDTMKQAIHQLVVPAESDEEQGGAFVHGLHDDHDDHAKEQTAS